MFSSAFLPDFVGQWGPNFWVCYFLKYEIHQYNVFKLILNNSFVYSERMYLNYIPYSIPLNFRYQLRGCRIVQGCRMNVVDTAFESSWSPHSENIYTLWGLSPTHFYKNWKIQTFRKIKDLNFWRKFDLKNDLKKRIFENH